MIKTSFIGLLRGVRRSASTGSRVQFISGNSELVSNTKDVQLRGIRIQGNFNDLPNLIFFPDMFDLAENWIPFFTNPKSGILDQRNVYIIYPRNFGSSDWCNDTSDDHSENVSNDIEAFMYQHKITMATLGGHGFGAKNAFLTGCFKPHLVTGLMAFDYAPQDYTYFRAAANLRSAAQQLGQLAQKPFFKSDFQDIVEDVQSPKFKSILNQNLRQVGARNFALKFNAPFVAQQFEEYVNWKKVQYGLYGGRVSFIFPEYSNYVFLNSNTLSMMKVCPKTQGYFHDIQSVMTESDNAEANHWVYEDPQLAEDFQKQATTFLAKYDGVNVQLMNRAEIAEGVSIPVRGYRERNDYYTGNVSPPHFYHNWRFTDRADLK